MPRHGRSFPFRARFRRRTFTGILGVAGTAAILFDATGAGASIVSAAGTAAISVGASGEGAIAATTASAAGTAALVVGASGTGASSAASAGTAAIVVVGASATGAATASGAGTAAIVFGATATGAFGSSTGAGAGSAAITVGATGVGADATTALPVPLAYWPFDEATGTTAADASGHGHTATLVHGTWDTSALKKFGAAALKNTDGAYGASFAPITLGTDYSIAFWMNGWDGANDGLSLGGALEHYATYLDSTTWFHSSGTSNYVSVPHGGLTGSHHIVVTRSGTTVTFYKDGTSLGARTLLANVALTLSTISGYVANTYALVATLDDVRLYDVALSATQVAALFALVPPSAGAGTAAVTLAASGVGASTGGASTALIRIQGTPRTRAVLATSVSITFATPPTVGNGIVVPVILYNSAGLINAGTLSCADNRGNPYTLAIVKSSALIGSAIFVCPKVVIATAPFTITITQTTASYFEASAIEVGGAVGLGLVIDQTTSQAAVTGAPSTGTTAALTHADVFVVAALAVNANQTAITVESVTPAWLQEWENLDHSTSIAGEADSRPRGSALSTTQACSWTVATAQGTAAVLAVFAALVPVSAAGTAPIVWSGLGAGASVAAGVGTAAIRFDATAEGVAAAPLRATQLVAELLAPVPPSPVVATQVTAELLLALPPQPDEARVTQLLCELIVLPRAVPPCTAGALPIDDAGQGSSCRIPGEGEGAGGPPIEPSPLVPAGTIMVGGWGNSPAGPGCAFLSPDGQTTYPKPPGWATDQADISAFCRTSAGHIGLVGGNAPHFDATGSGLLKASDLSVLSEYTGRRFGQFCIAADAVGYWYAARRSGLPDDADTTGNHLLVTRFNAASEEVATWDISLGGPSGYQQSGLWALAVRGDGQLAYVWLQHNPFSSDPDRLNFRVQIVDLSGAGALVGQLSSDYTQHPGANSLLVVPGSGDILVAYNRLNGNTSGGSGGPGALKRYRPDGTVVWTAGTPAEPTGFGYFDWEGISPGLPGDTHFLAWAYTYDETSSGARYCWFDYATGAPDNTRNFAPDDGAGFYFDSQFIVLAEPISVTRTRRSRKGSP